MTRRRSSCCRKSNQSVAASILRPLRKDGALCQTQAGNMNASSPRRARSKGPWSLLSLPVPSPLWTSGPCAHLHNRPPSYVLVLLLHLPPRNCSRALNWELFPPEFVTTCAEEMMVRPENLDLDFTTNLTSCTLHPEHPETRLGNDSSSYRAPPPLSLVPCPTRTDDPTLHSPPAEPAWLLP